jgi:hypothetical protein
MRTHMWKNVMRLLTCLDGGFIQAARVVLREVEKSRPVVEPVFAVVAAFGL